MKITLCGSTRFMDRFNELNRELTKQGHIVYSVSAFGHSGDVLTPEEKETLDLVHFKKILESEAIVVIGRMPDGTFYIGDSTRRELKWALMNEKQVMSEAAFAEDRIQGVENTTLKNPSFESVIEWFMTCCKPQEGGTEQ